MIKLLLKLLGLEDKPIYQSVTVWGLALLVGGQAMILQVCGAPEMLFSGDVTMGNAFCDNANSLMTQLGTILTALGVRKASK